jgi:signal transduction histidine kinase
MLRPNLSPLQQVDRQPQTIALATVTRRPKFVSLRTKLLVGCSLAFAAVWAGVFYRAYSLATDQAVSHIAEDLTSTLTAAARQVDGDTFLALSQAGKTREDGYSDDPRYWQHVNWLATVEDIEPRAFTYTYVAAAAPEAIVFVGSGSAINHRIDGAKFLEYYDIKAEEGSIEGSILHQGLSRQMISTDPFTDQWGTWISGVTPITNAQGEKVGALGVDFRFDYVHDIQMAIRRQFLISFIPTYGILFTLVYVLSNELTKHLTKLTESAEFIGAGNYEQGLSYSRQSRFPDEMDILAKVFDLMINSIRTREQLIRESKQVEDEIRHALQVEKELGELKSRFVAMVSHELRTPLTVIKTSTEILEHYGQKTTEAKKQQYFYRIQAAIQNMTQLLEDVLVANQAETGQLDFHPMPLDLEQFCRETVAEMQPEPGSRPAIAFTSQINGETTCVDKKLLRFILVNLLSNALKYSKPGGTVDLDLVCHKQMAVFTVRDRGIGIPAEDQPHLFKLFHRASNVEAIQGTGLGLAIAQQCVILHCGEISFTSQLGEGTTFTVKIPLQETQPVLLG